MKTLYKIKRAKDVSRLKEKFFVLDLETDWILEARPEHFRFGCMVGHNYRKVFYSIEEFHREFEKKQFRHKYIFAHNGGTFDFTVLFDNIKKYLDRKAIFNGSTFILAKKGLTYFADSLNIFKDSVANIGKHIGLEKLEASGEFKKGEKITNQDIEYCFRDCDIIYNALQAMFETVGSVKPTLASLALQFFRSTFQPFHIVYNEELCNEFFESYYGGRVECLKLGETHSNKYDVNSMYPYAMVNCIFPNPAYLKKETVLTKKRLDYHLKYHEGLVQVTVKHKKKNFGFLPLKKDNKLLFPAGVFKGTYNFNELRFALHHKVIEIEKIHSIIYAPPMKSPFIDYVNTNYEARQKATGIYNGIYKLLLNTLYGKFAQREKYEEIYFEETPLDFIGELIEKNIEHEVLHFNATRNDCYIKIPCRAKQRLHTIALFSSYITSFSRIHLLKSMVKMESNIITYLDTDCIAIEKSLPNFKDSFELGEFKLESDIITKILGNKSYDYNKGGKIGKKLKGVPLKKATEIKENVFTFDTLIKTKGAIRRNVDAGKKETITKVFSTRYDKREVKKSGFTKILYLDEY